MKWQQQFVLTTVVEVDGKMAGLLHSYSFSKTCKLRSLVVGKRF